MKTTRFWWLILALLLLSACGGKPSPQETLPAEVEQQVEDLPLPASEQTLQAGGAQVVTTILQTAAIPITYTLPASLPGESITPTLDTSLQPADIAPIATQQLFLGLVLSGEGITPVAESAPPVLEAPQAKEVIIQPEPRAATALTTLFIPGFTCLLGILLLMLGIVMVNTASQQGQQVTSVIKIADLQPGMGWVELQGNITQIPHPLDNNPTTPLAVLRLVIEQSDPAGGWKVVLDRVKATEFSLKEDDGAGTVWISPEQLDLSLLGEGSFASISQAEEALKILGLKPSSAWGKGLRYRIWELRGGQTLIAVGNIQQQLRLEGTSTDPLTLSPLDGTSQSASTAEATQKKSNLLLILVFTLGGAAVLAAAAWVLILLLG
jgi:hypothetical protein